MQNPWFLQTLRKGLCVSMKKSSLVCTNPQCYSNWFGQTMERLRMKKNVSGPVVFAQTTDYISLVKTFLRMWPSFLFLKPTTDNQWFVEARVSF